MKLKHKLATVFFSALLVISLGVNAVLPLVSNQTTVNAATSITSAKWVDSKKLKANDGRIFNDAGVGKIPQGGDTFYHRYNVTGGDTKCMSTIAFPPDTNIATATKAIYIDYNDGCQVVGNGSLSITNKQTDVEEATTDPGNGKSITAKWTARDALKGSDGITYTVTSGGFGGDSTTTNADAFKGDRGISSDKNCIPFIIFYDGDADTSHTASWKNNCNATNNTGTAKILNDRPKDPNATDEGDNTDPTCESSSGSLGWIMCPLIDGLQAAIGGIYDGIIQDLLRTDPLPMANKASNGTYQAWSNFRVYGDIFLVIALIVIVFGESIGGGLIDAYTAKKVLPRLLVAGILINISYYVVAILVDVTNIIGDGMMDLIVAPFRLTGDFSIEIGTAGATTMTTFLAGAAVWAKFSLAGTWMSWLWFCVLLPMLLIFLSILVVVLLRRALIVLLVIVSPVAFALYCLPNTEKYFKKWWELLTQTLLVYPIIAVLFAMGKVGAHLISQSGGDNWGLNGIGDVMAIITMVIPLLLVPFAFKIAGGLLGRAAELATGARGRMKIGEHSRERIRGQMARNRVQARQKYYQKLEDSASKGGAFRRATYGRALKGANTLLGGYNIEAAASAARAEVGKTINDQIATGRDEEIRGLTVNKNTSRSRVNAQGIKEYETLGGAWVSEADVDKGHARWGNDTFAQQAALAYEMRKAQDEGQAQNLAANYHNVAQGRGGWGMDDQQAGGAWLGAAFEHQNLHLEYKGTDWETGKLKTDKATGLRGGSFVTEAYEKKGNYALSQMGSNTIEQLKDAWHSTDEVMAANPEGSAAHTAALDQRKKLAAIAETFMSRYGGNTGAASDDPAIVAAMQNSAAEAAQQLNARGVPSDSPEGEETIRRAREAAGYSANSSGAAHVAERVVEFAQLTGVYRAIPRTSDSTTDHQGNSPQN